MKLPSLRQLAERVHARYVGAETQMAPFCIDTRVLSPGDIFVAIQAARDGHDFIPEAIQKGASALIVSRVYEGEISIPQVIVENTVIGMGKLASAWRMHFSIPVIGVTGSCGKSGTKTMIHEILSTLGHTLCTEGNLNNQLGVPMTLSRLNATHQFAVIEMGTNYVGEIPYLAEMVKPSASLVTNIRASHLEGFGSFDALAYEKAQIYRFLLPQGTAVINADEMYADVFYAQLQQQQTVTFGVHHPADIWVDQVEYTPKGLYFTLHTVLGAQAYHVPLLGDHVIYNAVASAAMALTVGASLDHIQRGFDRLTPLPGRFCPHYLKSGVVVIDDAYNASASSVESALLSLARFEGDRLFVMSSFGELGEFSEEYHRRLGEWIAASPVRQAFLSGDADLLAKTAELSGGKAVIYPDKASLLVALKKELRSNSIVLVKGTHASGMVKIAEQLCQEEV